MRRMAQRWVAVKIPDLKNLDSDTILRMYLKSTHCKNVMMKLPDLEKAKKNKTTHEVTEVEAFHKSQNYYYESEKRPPSLKVPPNH